MRHWSTTEKRATDAVSLFVVEVGDSTSAVYVTELPTYGGKAGAGRIVRVNMNLRGHATA